MKSDLKMWHLSLMAWVTLGYAVIFWYFTDQMGQGGMFDYMILGYDQTSYRNNLYQLGESGLELYKFQALPLDMIYPFYYGMTSMIAWEMLVKATNPKLYWVGAAVIMIGIIFDYSENIRLGILLFDFQKPSVDYINITANYTLAKWVFIGFSVIMLSTIAIYRLLQIRRQKTNG